MEEHRAEHATAVASPPARDGSGGPPPSPGEPAIWSRNFRYYFVARSAGLLSWAMLPGAVAAGLLIDGYGLDAAGYSMAFLVAPCAGLVLFGGVLADRFTARRMMIVADLANLAAHNLLALLFLHGIDHLWQLYALLVVAGTANALFQPGASSTARRRPGAPDRCRRLLPHRHRPAGRPPDPHPAPGAGPPLRVRPGPAGDAAADRTPRPARCARRAVPRGGTPGGGSPPRAP